MKKFLLAMIVICIAGIVKAQDKVVVDDKNAQVRTISGSFNAISVSSSIDLYLSQGNSETVVVSAAEDKYRDRIITEIKDGTLRIYYDDRNFHWMSTNRKLKAYVSFKEIEKLSASGSSDVYVNGVIRGEKLDLHLSGSSDFKGAVQVVNLSVDQSGSSDSRITGSAKSASIEVSGASDVKGYDLQVDYLDCHASGSSDVQITVNKEMNATASGASDIYYRGEGLIRSIKSSGSSSISRRS
ncbi:MAG: DUF2807 domain-containing protein [Bacteroidetes bacterium]|nr:MAG: DUF2807 domain-containing protein [Bacteroidota bacterium]